MKSSTLETRFRASYVIAESGCWEWTKGKTGLGRPTIYYGKREGKDLQQYAHRVSYELHVGDVPDGLFVCHHCDNPSCVNPDHLFLGTAMDNRRDMVSKGRDPRGEAHSDAIKRGSDDRSNELRRQATIRRHQQSRIDAGVPLHFLHCPSCSEWKEPDGFHRNSSTERGYTSHCKVCRSEQRAA